ncbi:hypothetical protein ES705_12115 [subsurface metagenome]
MKKYLLIIALLAFLPEMVFTQACCGAMAGGMGTAGARFGLGTAGARSLQLQFAYDLNYMNGLYDGDIRLEDNDRLRVIHSGIIEANYGISRKLSVAGIMTYVGQELASTRLDGGRQIDYLWGFGDMVFMVKFRLMNPLAYNGWGIVAGIGPKLPTGSFSQSGSNNSLFPMDVQSGSGSFDAISWLSFSKSHILITNLYLSSGATFRLSGQNRNFQDSLTYSFGNEFQYTAGLSYNFYGGIVFDIFNYVRYRYQVTDKLCEEPVEKTGGHWLFISPGIRVNFTQNFSFVVSADLPFYRNLEGPQLTTSYRFSAALMYNITPRQLNEIKPDQ